MGFLLADPNLDRSYLASVTVADIVDEDNPVSVAENGVIEVSVVTTVTGASPVVSGAIVECCRSQDTQL